MSQIIGLIQLDDKDKAVSKINMYNCELCKHAFKDEFAAISHLKGLSI